MNFRIPLSAPDITAAEIDAVTAVLHTPQLSLGPQLITFESALAAYQHVEHAVAVSSGTAALHLALVSLGIGEGDEVILPSFTFVAVANAIHQVRATPVFVEIDATTLNLDPDAVQRAVTARTRAIVVVHTFGVPAQMDALLQIANKHGLRVIEDACEAIGARFMGQPVGSFGDCAVLGFYPNKQITTGEGGALLCKSAEIADRARSLRNQGRSGSDWLDHAEHGYNYRLSELACALGLAQLQRIHEILDTRSKVAAHYDRLLAALPGVETPPLTHPDRELSWFVYVVRLANGIDREQVRQSLAEQGIASGRYFPPIHRQPAWQPLASAVALPVTEEIAARTLALPFFNRISTCQQQTVADCLGQAISLAK